MATATPTLRPPASCACWRLAAEGNPDLSQVTRWTLLNFVADAYVTTRETAYVKDMTFNLERPGQTVVSVTVPAYFRGAEDVDASPDITTLADVYQSFWSYQVGSTDNEGVYHLHLDITCDWKRTTSLESQRPSQSTGLGGFLGSFWRSLLGLFGLQSADETTSQSLWPPAWTIKPTGKTLQLGTFGPLPTLPAGSCEDLYFQVLP